MSGFIHLRKLDDGKEEPFPAIHYIVGAAWNAPITGGHLIQGTIAKGNLEVFITEILGIDSKHEDNVNIHAPENWYVETGKQGKPSPCQTEFQTCHFQNTPSKTAPFIFQELSDG
jgi:hypothetical protein